MTKHAFAKEAELCSAFIECLPNGWTAYPETGGFDIVLVRAGDGVQIGVEAKLKLNGKVILQAADRNDSYSVAGEKPDFRAVLIPDGVSLELAPLLPLLGITCIRMGDIARGEDGKPILNHGYFQHRDGGWSRPFHPYLPDSSRHGDDGWYECCPARRLALPDYVPDVGAGNSAPVALTHWKIGAIKLVITLQRRGYLTRQDFAHFQISISRWTQEKWLVRDGSGGWVAGPYLPNFKAQHPVNFDQIAADFEKWQAPATATQRGLFVEGAK